MSFLQNYRIFTSGNEAHPTYHTFSALVALSSIVSRKVWIDLGYFNIYPNLYVVLVGPPGNRKTTAMSVCKRLLRELNKENNANPTIPFSAECQTKESLVKELASYQRAAKWTNPDSQEEESIIYSPITVCVTELSQFLGASSAHMVDFLTTVYDQDYYDLKTKNKGIETILGPYLTLLACTTPAWITARLRDDVISGGFSRRALFVFETDKAEKVAFPKITLEMEVAWNKVVDYSRTLSHVKGCFKWAVDAKAWYENWYKNLKVPASETLAGYYDSKHIQLVKMAMLIALAERPELLLEVRHLQFALELLELMERNLERVFSGIGRNELNGVAQKIIELLNLAPGKMLPEKFIRKELFKDAAPDEIVKVLMHLEGTDRIKRMKETLSAEDTKAGKQAKVMIKLQ
jgi:hypothetical protein